MKELWYGRQNGAQIKVAVKSIQPQRLMYSTKQESSQAPTKILLSLFLACTRSCGDSEKIFTLIKFNPLQLGFPLRPAISRFLVSRYVSNVV